MLTNNACITLYHKVYDPALRGDTWKRTQFQGCNWYGCQAVTVGNNGLDAAGKQTNLYTVRIPGQDALQAAPGDIVVHGLCEDERPQEAQKRAAEGFLVTAVRDNRWGMLPHWKLEGV